MTPPSIGPITITPEDWRMQPAPIVTRWASSVSPTNAWAEYPRPQMARTHWQNLNGLWDYAITARDVVPPHQYDGRILVPYPVESALSGVKRSLHADQWLWYRRKLDVGIGPMGGRVLLHFGAVDYEAAVYLNGRELGAHSGGYQSFSFDITKLLRTGENELVVRVYDPTEQGPNPQGKQKVNAQWMFYGASSGIWQTVWIEHVASTYISALKLTPDVDRSEVRIDVSVDGEKDALSIEAIARDGDEVVARGKIQGATALRINQPRLWSPDDPHLYDLELRLIQGDRVVDSVKSYFGLRKIAIKADSEGRARIHLNDRYTYNLAAVDQGYWPDGLYTAPTDAALEFDVQAIKALGFNTVRKHLKIEPQRWYYHCDRLGLLVWQDMPSSKNDSPEAHLQFEREIEENLRQLYNHPSITTWVLFNEGWGAYDQERLARWMKYADPSRLLNGHSGPYDQIGESRRGRAREVALLLRPLGGPGPVMSDPCSTQFQAPESRMAGDMADLHFYPGPRMFPAQAERVSVTGEYGSFGVYIEGHVWDELGKVGIGMGGTAMSPQQMLAAYANSIQKLRVLEREGLSGSGYFEIFDVEGEHQGFLTYDRAVAKVSVAEVARLNAQIVPRATNYEKAIESFFVEDADQTPDSQRYEQLFQEFRSGQRDLMFLRRLSSLALRLGNIAHATELANEFISLTPRPYTKEIWRSILAITGSSQCKGFELLRACADEINASLGEQAAQKKILDIVGRELIVPYFQEKQRKTTWTEFESSVALAHGQLGKEAVIGARMMEALSKEDWTSFAASYVRYFETAIPRSPYSLHALSYQILRHVTDLRAIEVAIRVMGWQIKAVREWPVCGRYDAIELDTYANLLHKMGRTLEAVEWLQKAVDLSGGHDGEIAASLERMKRAASISPR